MNDKISISEEELHEIEQFLRQELSVEAKADFEARLASDSVWRQKVDSVRLMIVGIKEAALSENLRKINLGSVTAIRTMRPVWKKLLPYAAAVVTGLLLSVLILTGIFQNKNDKLFAEFYRPDTGLITAMSVTEEYDFEVAMVDYKSENYQAAIQKWTALAESHGSNDTLAYFIGNALLAMDKVPEAISYLQLVLENSQSVFYHDAQWYYGLALIKEGRDEEAIAYIAGSNDENKEKLLKKLRRR